MHTESCQQCDKRFTKSNRKSAILALRMHQGRRHGNIITPSREKSVFSRADVSKQSEPKARKKYTRRTKTEHEHGFHAKFCPGCGFNLALLTVALSVASKIKNEK